MVRFNPFVVFLSFILAFFSLQINSYAQILEEITTDEATESAGPMKLLVITAKIDSHKVNPIDQEIATLVSNIVLDLVDIEVIKEIFTKEDQHRTEQKELLRDSTLEDEEAIKFAKLVGAEETIVINIQNYSQKGVPPERNDKSDEIGLIHSVPNLFSSLFKSGSAKDCTDIYPTNIRTNLLVQIRILDVENGALFYAFDVDATHTGGAKVKSRTKALEKFEHKVLTELKTVYLPGSKGKLTGNGKIFSFKKSDLSIYPGMTFELVQSESKKTVDSKTITIPGGTVGYGTVHDTTGNTIGVKILRQWQPIESECWALEQRKAIHAFNFSFTPPVTEKFTSVDILYHGDPEKDYDWGLGMRAIRVTDSFDRDDYGFGFEGFAGRRFYNHPRYNFGLEVGLGIDFPFRKDNAGNTVSALIASCPVRITAEILLSSNYDLVINAGYRFATTTNDWTYSEDDQSHSAVWEGDIAPEVTNSGFLFSVGYRYLFE